MSVTFVDGVTPLNAANMNSLESKPQKGQVNGYASLDATGKVPTAQLPPLGVDLVYDGSFVQGPTYKDGEIVIASDGIAYMCVGGPTTQAPVPWVGSNAYAVSYGTSLPANPINGQEAILVDSTTNPTYQWRFRYNANSTSAYKWEFVGGTPVCVAYSGQDSLAVNASYVNIPNGPSFALPRSGDWLFEVEAIVSSSTVDAQVYIGGGDSSLATGGQIMPVSPFGQPAVAGRWQTVHTKGRCNAVTFATFTMKSYPQAGTCQYAARVLTVQPVRVS